MSDTYHAVIPYESMDPLAIGATDDESKKHRDTLTLEIPSANLVAAIYPDEPEPVGDATEAARLALTEPVDGPTFAELLAGKSSIAVVIDNQFRPTPSSKLLPAVFDAIEAAGVTRRQGRVRERQGVPHVRGGHGAEARAREPRADGGERLGVPPERPPEPGRLHVRRRLVGRDAGVAARRGRLERPQDHDRPGAGEPLGRRRRRQADPAGRRVGRDDRVEPLRVRHLAADALRRLRRSDALGHRRGGDDVRSRLHDERDPRHARPRDRLHLRLPPRGASRGDPPLQRDLCLRQLGRGEGTGGHRDLRRLRARPTTCSSTRAGAACRPISS